MDEVAQPAPGPLIRLKIISFGIRQPQVPLPALLVRARENLNMQSLQNRRKEDESSTTEKSLQTVSQAEFSLTLKMDHSVHSGASAFLH